jgi:DDE superfamily endonuclease
MASGPLMELEDHNCWTIAEAAGHRGPHRLQHLLSRTVWDEQRILDIASAWAAGHLDNGDAVLIVAETADEKSSTDAVGPARQLRRGIRQRAMCYVMAVSANQAVTTGPGRTVAAPSAVTMIPARAWNRMRAGSGTKGTRHYDWAMLQVTRDDTPMGSLMGTACCWPGGTAAPARCRSTGAEHPARSRCPG